MFLEFFTEALSDGNTEFDLESIQKNAHLISEYTLRCHNFFYGDDEPEITQSPIKWEIVHNLYYDRNNRYTTLSDWE